MDPRALSTIPVFVGNANQLTEVNKIKTDEPVELKWLTPSPLSSRSKQMLVEELKQKDIALLKQALVAAALNMHEFPKPINQKLANLQLVYREQQGNDLVAPLLKQAIVNYVESEMMVQICEY